MTCNRCGQNVTDADGLCSNCGYKNRTTRRSSRTYEQQPLSYDGEPTPQRGRAQPAYEPQQQTRDTYEQPEAEPRRQARTQYNQHRQVDAYIDDTPAVPARRPSYSPESRQPSALQCAKCGSTNVSISMMQTAARTRTRGMGCLWEIGRWCLIVCTCGLWLLVGRRGATSKTKFKNEKVAICQSCGASWKMR
jgi:hypothetical protein